MTDAPENPSSKDTHPDDPDQPDQLDGLIQDAEGEQDERLLSAPSGRSASVRFRRERDADVVINQVRMDTAHQSLADALKITYGFLQFGMVVLLVLFVLSGFQKVNEGERGISVFLGNPSATNIEPGAHLTWPYPIGELITVNVGAVEVELAQEFMPSYSGVATLTSDLSRFNSQRRLEPSENFSLITSDQNLAHAQWKVNYHRSDHLKNEQNIFPGIESRMIGVAVKRGVVQTMAETSIDDLLKKSAETIASHARQIAQETLDGFESGITIDRLVLVTKTPPLALLDQFASVQSAAQNAGKLREDALLKRDQELNNVAGRASTVLILMINEYERHIELDESEQASELLAQIDIVLGGGEITYQGQNTLGLISGEVSEILNRAEALASMRVSRAIADLAQFKAKQEQFEANPTLMIARDWSSAMADFLDKDFVDVMYLPRGVDVELVINRDPAIEREQDRKRKDLEARRMMDMRYKSFIDNAYKTQRGIQEKDME